MVTSLQITNAATTNTLGTDPAWCTASYPTAYSTVNFSITEATFSNRRGFNPNQTSRTLILDMSNAVFNFNPGIGTVTVNNTGVTINSYVITSSQIIVTISTASTNTVANTISFNGIQVRATAAGSGFIRRNGGTFTIDRSNTNPSSTTRWTNLTANAFLAFSSATTTQTSTASVGPNTIDNRIIRVAITLTGACSALTATSFSLSTAGSTNALNDIDNAKLYYTGTSNTFTTATLFGTTNSPNGAFTITGNQSLTAAGTYYFWLTYDTKIGATGGNVIDAQASAVVLSGNTSTFTGNPAGSRSIVSLSYYSITGGNGNWNSTGNWSLTPGGVSCGCVPTAGSLVFISNNISLNTTISVTNVTISAGTLSNASGTLTVANTLATIGTGNFAATTAWSLQDVDLYGSGNSSFSSATNITLSGDINIGAGATLTRTNGSANLNFSGSVTVDGTLAYNNNNSNWSGTGLTIDGLGSITGSGTITISTNKTFPAFTTNLLIANPISISSGITVINKGTIKTSNSIIGGSGSSSWTNDVNSSLEMAGTTSALLTTGVFTASANPNTVIYSGSATQNVYSTTYHNLNITNATKTLRGNIVVNNDLTITGAGVIDVSSTNYSINIYRNWINNSSATNPLLYRSGTVSFIGNTVISGTAKSAFNNVTINIGAILTGHATTGKFTVSGNFTNNGDFAHNSSDITFIPAVSGLGGSSTSTILGSSVTNFNTLIVNSTKTLNLPSIELELDGNLTNNGILTANNGHLTFTGFGTTQTFDGTTASNILNTVEVDNASGAIVISNTLSINDSLIMNNGIITTPSSSITIAETGTTYGNSPSSYVSGTLKRVFSLPIGLEFPVGKGGNYRPLTFTYTSLTGTSTVTVDQTETALTGTMPGSSILNNSRTWDISQTGGSAFAYNLTLDGTGDVISGPVVIARKQSGTIGVTLATTPNYTNSVDYTTLTGTCNFATGSNCSVTSNAGTDQTGSATCGLSSITLAGNTASPATGAWLVISGTGGSFGNASSPTSTFSGTPGVDYTLQWRVTDANCVAGSSINVTLGQTIPSAPNATSSSSSICLGSTVNLSATQYPKITILNSNFNSGSVGWTKNITGTSGGTTANAVWTIQPNNYNPGNTISSNDGTNFYLSNSFAQNGIITSTILTSPSFSSVGFTSLSLDFWQYYRYNATTNEAATVQISTDGNVWTDLIQYTSNQGSSTSFSNPVIDISAYIDNPTVYVRFYFYCGSNVGRYWAIDNVTISGDYNYSYAWTSTPSGFTSTTQNPTNVAPNLSTDYTVTVTNPQGCTAISSPVSVSVNTALVVPSVSIAITSGTQTSCSGTPVTFTATPTNGGSAPTYQWTKNGTNIGGATSVTYTGTSGTAFINGDIIRCVMTTNATCPTTPSATSTGITMTVNSNVTPSVSIAITSGTNSGCAGSSITFSATPTNGGGSPTYDFRKNGVSVQNSTSTTYTTTSLVNADVISCVMTSNATCPSPATATSSNITMTLTAVPVVTSGSSATSVCSGVSFNLTSSATTSNVTVIASNFTSQGSWTATNTSTGGTTANAAWTIRTNNHFAGTGGYNATISSNDASNFYLSDSRVQNGTTTNTTLISPSFSTVGYSALTLDFYHFFDFANVSGESANVEVSTNGSSWTTLATYTSTQGSANAFVHPSINLNAYVGNATVFIRFRYAASLRARFWAIDNFTVTGTPSHTYLWTSTPSGFTSSSQNPTGVNQTVASTYTVTATNSIGCSATATAVSVGISNVTPTISISNTSTTLCSGAAFTSSITNGGASPAYQWKKNGGNVGTNSSTYTGSGLGLGDAITCVLTSNASCVTSATANSNSISFALSVPTTSWTGSVDNTWSTAGNWSAGVPTRDLIAAIPSGTPSISASAEVYDLNISSGASLTISGSNALSIYGSIANNGSITPNSSNVSMLGCAGTTGIAHNFNTSNNATTSLNSLTLNDANGATVNSTINIAGVLTLTTGTFTNNSTVILTSTSSKTGCLAPVLGGTYSGNLTQKRLAPAGNTGWAWLGSPVTNATLADWYNNNTEIYMSGFPGSSIAGGSFVSVYGYNETTNGFVAPTDISNSLVNGKGYWVYLGDGQTTTNNITFDVTGTPKIGSAALPVSYSPAGGAGWNLVANPYPCTINWASPSWTKTNMDNYFQVYNADINNYATFTLSPLDSTNGGSRMIPSSQGFFVKANAASPSLIASESVKSINSNPTFLRSANVASPNKLKFTVKKEGSKLADECLVKINSDAKDEFDVYDVEKVFPPSNMLPSVNIYTNADNQKMTINTISKFDVGFILPLSIKTVEAGTYTLNALNIAELAADYSSVFEGKKLVLEDVQTGKEIDINVESTYCFKAKNTEQTHNFLVRFANQNTLPSLQKVELFNSLNISRSNDKYFVNVEMNSKTAVTVELFNTNGQLVKPTLNQNVNNATIEVETSNLANGVYIIKVVAGGRMLTKKFVID